MEYTPTPRSQALERLPFKIAAIYTVLGGLWIFFSDQVAYILFPTPQALKQASMAKGWLYIILTALLLYKLVSHGIREIVKSQEVLRLSEERFRVMFELASVGMAQADPRSGRWLRVNEKFCAITGYTPDELTGMHFSEITHPEDRQHDGEAFQQVVHGEATDYHKEKRCLRKDGTTIWVNVNETLRKDSTGQPLFGLAVIEDITSRKEVEIALKASEEKFRLAMEVTQEGLWDWNLASGELYINPGFMRSFGYDPEKVDHTYNSWVAAMHPEDFPAYQEILQAHLAGHNPVFEAEFRGRIGDGQFRWFSSRGQVVARAADGAPLRMVGALRDITEKKQAQQALEESLSLYQATLESTADGILAVNNEGRIVSWNRKFTEMWRLPEDLINTRDNRQVRAYVADQLQDQQDFLTRARELFAHPFKETCDLLLFKDGRVFERFSIPQYLNSRIIGRVLSFRDVTARVQAEAGLRESETNFRTFFESMADMIFVITTDGRLLFANAAVRSTLGYSADELADMHVLTLHPPGQRPETEKIFAAILRGERNTCPLPLRGKDGGLVPAETRCWFGRWNGEDCVFGISKNLTAELEAQQRLEHLFRSNPSPMAVSNLPDQKFVEVNDAFLKFLRFSQDEVIGKTVGDLGLFVHPEQQAAAANKIIVDGRITDCELQVRAQDGEILYGLFSGEVINIQGQQYLLTVMMDITERQRAERELAASHRKLQEAAQQLEQSRNMLQMVIESIPVRVFWKDRDSRFLGCNTLFAGDAGLQHPQELVGKDDFSLGWQEQADLYRADDRQVMESRQPKMNIVEPQTTPTGGTIWLKTSKVPLSKTTGEVFGVLGVYEDITVLKEKEEKLRASLEEKEVMLKEIHHRVKNNMQMISTLFDLQLKYSGDQDPPSLFRDCQNRIRSMALIHESLYHTDTLASINFRHYLEKLVKRLMTSFGSSVQRIRATVASADLHLGINEAVPAGLVASELLVNCLKHAFPGQRAGEIKINLEAIGNQRVIEIKDNGVGLGQGSSLENFTSFGWLMISNLVKQLKGTITVTSNGGTACRMVF